jgi:hypothetical protein
VVGRQLADGRWSDDKWHSSWAYTTSHALIALLDTPSPDPAPVKRATHFLLNHQEADGGWGTDGKGANSEDTAYGVLALRALVNHGVDDPRTVGALRRGEQWMAAYRPFATSGDHSRRWLGKESYCPDRIVRMFELAATFPSTEGCLPPTTVQRQLSSAVTHSATEPSSPRK